MNTSKKILLSFDVDPSLLIGIQRLCAVLPFEIGEGGIRVTATQGDFTGVTLKNGVATVTYTQKHLFFRELGVLVEHASEAEFSVVEDNHFTGLSTMIDTSRNAVPTLPALYRLAGGSDPGGSGEI